MDIVSIIGADELAELSELYLASVTSVLSVLYVYVTLSDTRRLAEGNLGADSKEGLADRAW